MDGVRINILGPWEVRVRERVVEVPRGQLRTFLASLVLSMHEPVPVATLVDRAWPERVPGQARATLHTYATRLRKLLGPDLIETTRGGGYQLRVPSESIDLHQFRGLLCESRVAESPQSELALLRQALRLWRGRPFGDESSTWLDREVVPRLTEEWFGATERRIELELAAGQAGRLIPELWDLTDRFPTRESLWVLLITALHRAGRRAEALHAYQSVRSVLNNELGIDPSDRLVQLQRAILRDGTDAVTFGSAVAETRPRQLPHDIASFTGREGELRVLDELSADPSGTPTIVAIDGAPGTGKTTLAVHWAHRVAGRFPDAQLYLNLRGYGPGDPLTPAAASEMLLRAIGVPNDAIPAGVDERSALLRSRLSGRRTLILLDNASDADQVRPLLPGTKGLVIVTSRNQLRGLSVRDGAHRLTLRRLPREQAIELLGMAVGADRVAAEPTAAGRLADLCDHLPLALAIVAERAHRVGQLTEVVNALADEKSRLNNLDTGENDSQTDLRAALSWSYSALPRAAATMFRTLGLHPANDIGLETAAALANLPVAHAKQLLDHLVAAHMVEQRRPNRYELHDLIRLYAVDQATRHDPVDARQAVIRRMLDWYLHAAVSADRALFPHRRRDFVQPYEPRIPPPEFGTAAAAWSWLEQEYDSLRSVVAWAGANDRVGHAWRTAVAMTPFFDARIPWREGHEFYESVFHATEAAGDVLGEAHTLNSLSACLYLTKGDPEQAKTYLLLSLQRFLQLNDVRGLIMLEGNLGLMYAELGDPDTGVRYLRRALTLCRQLDHPRGMAHNLDNLGVAYSAAGDHGRAIDSFQQAHKILVELGETPADARCQRNLARAYAAIGDYRDAIGALRVSLGLYREIGSVRGEAQVLADLGKVLHSAGHPDLARRILETVLVAMTEIADPRADEVRVLLTSLVV